MKKFITNHKILSGVSILTLLLIWYCASSLIDKPLILPSPQSAFENLLILVESGDFWRHLTATISRGLTAFGISFGLSIMIGIVAGRYKWIEALLRPLLVCLRSTPSMSIILIALLWFKGERVPLFVISLVVLPLLIQNVIEGIRNIDFELLELLTLYRVKKSRLLLKFYIPSILPFLAAGVSNGLSLTWKVSIAAEVLAYPVWGIGTQMDTARVYLQTEKVFAWTVVVIGIGLLFDFISIFILRRSFIAWKGTEHV